MIFAEFNVTPMFGNSFRFVGRPWAEPSHAFTAAHDMFEHSPTDTGTLEEELMALGAGLFLRTKIVSSGLAIRTIEDVIAGDIFGHVLMPLAEKGMLNLRKCDQSLSKLPIDLSISFDKMMARRSKHWYSCPNEIANEALRWAKYGAIKALERYKGCPDIQDIFFRVWKLLSKILARHFSMGRLTIAVDPKTGTIEHDWRAIDK